MEEYWEVSEVIDWQYSKIMGCAQQIASEFGTPVTEIFRSFDYPMNFVACRALDVLQHRMGYCLAKSHLLAALLRSECMSAIQQDCCNITKNC